MKPEIKNNLKLAVLLFGGLHLILATAMFWIWFGEKVLGLK